MKSFGRLLTILALISSARAQASPLPSPDYFNDRAVFKVESSKTSSTQSGQDSIEAFARAQGTPKKLLKKVDAPKKQPPTKQQKRVVRKIRD